MILDKESWCDSVIPKVILEAIDVIRNQLRTPRPFRKSSHICRSITYSYCRTKLIESIECTID